jgi:hypothetical protein
LVVLLIVLSLAASLHAGLDISFSSDNGGNWSYTATGVGTGEFSFTEAGVDTLPVLDVPVKLGDSVYVPNIQVSLYSNPIAGTDIYVGTITSESAEIKINKGNGDSNILSGELNSGTIVVVGTTATLYPFINPDGDITEINWGDYSVDFSLTLQGEIDIATIILSGDQDIEVGGTFSGSIIVPEPATFFILAIGSVLMWKNKK